MLSKLRAPVLMASLGSAAATDGGCLMAAPRLPETCTCNANPTVSKFAGCKDGNPLYFDDLSDLPNGACVMYVDGAKKGTSMTTCSAGDDCLPGLDCQEGACVDASGVREADRLVMACVSPKTSDSTNVNAGCPFSDGDRILDCHKYWISPKGMAWKHYIQFNPLGKGDTYAWAYDEAVCATSGNQRRGSGYPWCTDQHGQSAVDSSGTVIDTACPCTVDNPIAPLQAVPFADQGWGHHMHVHIYDMMYPGYVKPTKPASFTPIDLPHVAAEDSEFYLKVVNQYKEEILVYMDAPPARKNEHVSGTGVNGAKWDGWTGPTKTLRGSVQAPEEVENADAWVSRITVAPNNDPSAASQPAMRVAAKGAKLGGFYVPKDHHLRIHIADQQAGGWFQTNTGCPNTACWGPGVSLWATRADAYNYPNRDPLLLLEPNVNAFTDKFEDGTIWFDLSAVDGINANLELRYGKIDRVVSTPLFQSEDESLAAEPDFNAENVTFLQ